MLPKPTGSMNRSKGQTPALREEMRPSATATAREQKSPRRGPAVNRLCTLRGPPAPQQGKHVPEVGLEPGSSPCKHGPPAETYGIRPSPAPVRPSPRPKVWTLSTPPIPHPGPQTAAPRIHRVRRSFALKNLILLEKFNCGCSRVLPAPVAESWACGTACSAS